MCEYCNDVKDIVHTKQNEFPKQETFVYIRGKEFCVEIYRDDGIVINVNTEIVYCPICGENLQ